MGEICPPYARSDGSTVRGRVTLRVERVGQVGVIIAIGLLVLALLVAAALASGPWILAAFVAGGMLAAVTHRPE